MIMDVHDKDFITHKNIFILLSLASARENTNTRNTNLEYHD